MLLTFSIYLVNHDTVMKARISGFAVGAVNNVASGGSAGEPGVLVSDLSNDSNSKGNPYNTQ